MTPVAHYHGYSLRRLIVLLAVGVVFMTVFVAQALRTVTNGWATTYDDAFISFRYAQHLAEGFGLVWNIDQPPTEGFSNLLLVLALALPIGLGIDPLMAARALSLAALTAIAVTLYHVARRHYGANRSAALMPVAILLVTPAALSLALIGMETTLYSFALLVTVVSGVRLIRRSTLTNAVSFSLVAFAGILLRPDAALAQVIVLLVGFAIFAKRRLLWMGGLWSLLATALLVIPYGIWKYIYFGDILPNPYYIKSGSLTISSLGVASVEGFLSTYLVVLLFALVGALMTISGRRAPREPADTSQSPPPVDLYLKIGGLLVGAYLLYFATTDTLMDIEGRFLFPLVPIVTLLGIPTYSALRGLMAARPLSLAMASVATVGVILLLIAGFTTSGIRQELRGERWSALTDVFAVPRDVNAHWGLAEQLRRYPDIEQVYIAYGDAGILPYVTRAKVLDPVGLNDSYIARTKDTGALTDYFFEQRPDLVILPSDHDGGWITYGHGPLGDYQSWSLDPRWNEYTYVGTDRRSDLPYDLQFLVRKDAENAEDFSRFLKTIVVDGSFDKLPWALGTTLGEASPSWTDLLTPG